jgi:hypothetical protein
MRLRRLLKVILCSWATSVYAYVRFWRIQASEALFAFINRSPDGEQS